MSLLKYFYLAYPMRTIIVFLTTTVAGMLAGIGISALLPLLTKLFNNKSTEKNAFDKAYDQLFQIIGINPTIESLLVFIVLTMILKSILLSATNIYAGFTVAKVTKDLRSKLLLEMSKAEWKFFINQPSGKLAASLTSETNKAGANYLISLSMLSAFVQLLIILVISFLISWQIVLISILSSVALAIFMNKLISISRKLGNQNTLLIRETMRQLTDSLRSIKSLKAMSRESNSNALLNSYTKEIKEVDKKSTVTSEALIAFQEIYLILIIVVGIYLAMNTLSISIEEIIFLSLLFMKSMKLVAKIQKNHLTFQQKISGFEGIMDSINSAQKNCEVRNGSSNKKLEDNIYLNDICFSYGNNVIFNNASAVIYYKKLNSIIGPSGAGKTTFVDLICGLYTPTSGDIKIGNISLTDIKINYWRKQIGYVVQDNTLLNSTIKENIILGDYTLSDELVNLALKRANADIFVNSLPNGSNTLVGEFGTKLSGGQRQRILIARAIVHSPKLLILDEATSALDEDTEESLSLVFKELSKDITIISISHRQALIRASDHVLKIHNKKLISENLV